MGIRPRRPERSLDYSDAFITEDLVEGGAELRVAVVDQEPNVGESTAEAEVARLLRDPAPIRIRGGAGEADAAALKFDEEEHVVATQEGSLDREEVARQDARCLLAQELAPSRARSPRRRPKPSCGEQSPNGARGDGDAELRKLAADPLVAPARISAREPQRECLASLQQAQI
jgi:hypothetical protein